MHCMEALDIRYKMLWIVYIQSEVQQQSMEFL